MAKIEDYPAVYQYTGNGATRAFQFRCMFWEVSNIVVYLNHTIQTSGYTITSEDFNEGGTVTFNTAPANGVKITIKRVLPKKRLTEFYESGVFRAAPTNEEINHIYALIQGNADDIERRCVKVTDTDDQTPEELLGEVYDKLDSATEIAAEAIEAANNATEAVESAEQTLAEVTSYVDAAKVDINNTKTAAEAEITATKDSAIGTINTTVTEANTEIEQYFSDAEAEVRQIASDEAKKAIADVATEATNTAKANVNSYVDGTIKPDLQTYVTAAANSASSASNSATEAETAKTSAKTQADLAKQYADDINNTKNNLVTKNTIQTITASKRFQKTGVLMEFCNPNYPTAGTIPTTEAFSSLCFSAVSGNNSYFAQMDADVKTTGDMYYRMYLKNVFNKDKAGTQVSMNIPASGESYIQLSADKILVPNPPTADSSTRAATTNWVREYRTSIVTKTETSGSVSLSVNSIFAMNITGETTFSLPASGTTLFNQIKLMLKVTGTPTINWGTTYFYNKETPAIEEGSYDVYYDYDPVINQWVCGVISKGVA